MIGKRKFTVILVLALLFGVMLTSSVAYSQSREITDDEVNAVAKDLYCPVCESTPLDVCPTQACADWREVIRDKLGQGQSPDEIREYFALQYGPRALSEPPREGFSLAVWIGAIAAVLVGGFMFLRYVRGIRVNKEHDPTAVTAATNVTINTNVTETDSDSESDEYEARIEQELREKYS